MTACFYSLPRFVCVFVFKHSYDHISRAIGRVMGETETEWNIIINSKCGTYNANWVMKWLGGAEKSGLKQTLPAIKMATYAKKRCRPRLTSFKFIYKKKEIPLQKKKKKRSAEIICPNELVAFDFWLLCAYSNIASLTRSLWLYNQYFSVKFSFWFNLCWQIEWQSVRSNLLHKYFAISTRSKQSENTLPA